MRRNFATLIVLGVSFTSLHCASPTANTPTTAVNPSPSPIDRARWNPTPTTGQETWLLVTAERIKTDRPAVSEEILVRDQQIIIASFPAIEQTFSERGYTQWDARVAAVDTWQDFRLGKNSMSPSETFDSTTFMQSANRRGALAIKSVPTDADIWLNGSKQDYKTDKTKWLSPGEYKVRVSKEPEYGPIEESKTVKTGNVVVFNRTLPKK